MAKQILKWSAIVLLGVAAAAFVAFLYLIPPFFVAAPETFSKPMLDAAPAVGGIADPKQRAIAERGRYLVVTTGCQGCHQVPGPQGPDYTRYLAGGMRFHSERGTFVTRNLTPDPDTGLARRTDDDIKRVLRSGLFPDGRVVSYRVMPWGATTHLSEEDRHAMVVYLRHLGPVRHQIPEPSALPGFSAPGVVEEAYAGRDYGSASK